MVRVADGEVLGADFSDAVEVSEVVDDEVAHLTGGEGLAGVWVYDEVAAPVGEAVATFWAAGVGLAGELGHAVFVMNLGEWDGEVLAEFLVEFGLREGEGAAFVASGFEEL